MKLLILFLSLIFMFSCSTEKSSNKQKWAIAIHGGAGTITKEGLKGDMEKLGRKQNIEGISVSMSHTKTYAQAMAILVRKSNEKA